ncbi:hypothetical protein J6590_001103 [Homalodisca vitripennis]|nr:hypothetical protein J6590_001103 [Homalodisca vitripennis]
MESEVRAKKPSLTHLNLGHQQLKGYFRTTTNGRAESWGHVMVSSTGELGVGNGKWCYIVGLYIRFRFARACQQKRQWTGISPLRQHPCFMVPNEALRFGESEALHCQSLTALFDGKRRAFMKSFHVICEGLDCNKNPRIPLADKAI